MREKTHGAANKCGAELNKEGEKTRVVHKDIRIRICW
jgi:hypothetical protein